MRKEAEAEEGAPEAMKGEREEEEEEVEAASPAERGEESYCGNRRGGRRRAITLHEQPSTPLPHPPTRSLLRHKEKSLVLSSCKQQMIQTFSRKIRIEWASWRLGITFPSSNEIHV